MDLIALSARKAGEFSPKKPTALMRIFSRDSTFNKGYPIINSGLYSAVFEYEFDDVTWLSASEMDRHSRLTDDESLQYSYLSNELSRKLVQDFVSIKDRIKCLAVHCRLGESRSPAVIIALNDAFHLGQNNDSLVADYPHANPAVYEQILNASLDYIDANK